MGKIWLPNGVDNKFSTEYIGANKMTVDELNTWANSQASVTNLEVVQTACLNKRLGTAIGIINTTLVFATAIAGVIVIRRCTKKAHKSQEGK